MTDTQLSHLQKSIALPGSDHYYSTYFLPPPIRKTVLALYALQKSLADNLHQISEPDVLQKKLFWWHEETQRLFNNQAQHPITQALSPWTLPADQLTGVVQGIYQAAMTNHYPNFAALTHHYHQVFSLTELLVAQACGASMDETTVRFSQTISTGLGLRETLCHLRRDLLAERCYLPQDELDAQGLSIETLLNGTESLCVVLQQQCDRAKTALEQGLENIPSSEVTLPNVVQARLAMAQLSLLEEADFPVLKESIQLTPFRKLWISRKVMKAWRKNKK